jgi:hypothetical protein
MAITSLARSRKLRAVNLAPLVLAGSMSLLSACSSSVTDPSATEMGGKGRKVGVTGATSSSSTNATATTTTTTTAITSGTATYDTSIGSGVDSNGFANLPLRSGAHRFFVNSSTGSDSNGCSGAQKAASPLATIAAAKACVTGGNGDQILIAQDTSYSEGLTNMMSQTGYSAQYPTVIESYDPADPLNEALYGRAANGHRPVINTGANKEQMITCYCGNTPNNPNNYLAIRGLDINPGNLPDMDMSFAGPTNYVLIENNIFRYTSLSFDNGGSSVPRSSHHVVRMNAFYGEWSPTAHAQGMYDSGTDGVTVEDNVFWHNGWKVGVTRDEPVATGGPTMFRHPLYAQNTLTGIIYRRNLVIEAAADGGHLLSDVLATENVIIDCPIGLDMTQGVNGNTRNPSGVDRQVSYNAVIGSEDLNSTNPRGYGFVSDGSSSGSSIHHNLLVDVNNIGGTNRVTFSTAADSGVSTYTDFHDNVAYLRAVSGHTHLEYQDLTTTPASYVYVTFENNIWDDPASGTNRNIGSVSFPNPYTPAQLYAALGFADRQSYVNYAIEHPETHPAPQARALLFAGYGMTP